MKSGLKKKQELGNVGFGSQLAGLGLLSSDELTEQLNQSKGAGYRLSSQTLALAEKILSKKAEDQKALIFTGLGGDHNLALAGIHVALALRVVSRRSTLIVQATPTRPDLDEAFGAIERGTWSKWLTMQASVPSETLVPHLGFFPYGTEINGEVFLVTAERVQTLIQHVSEDYEQVVFIAPEVATPEFTSILLGGRQAVGLTMEGKTALEKVKFLTNLCFDLNADMLGTIFVGSNQ